MRFLCARRRYYYDGARAPRRPYDDLNRRTPIDLQCRLKCAISVYYESNFESTVLFVGEVN